MILPKIYPITNTDLTAMSHTQQIRQLVEGGADLIQLRDKTASSDVFYNDALDAIKAVGSSNAKLIINDRVDIALAVNAAGVHLGQDDLPPEAAREILGENALIGLSTHNLAQALKAVFLPIDYIAIGPVFDTSTKQDTDPAVGLDGVRRMRDATKGFPLVAIGGINIDNFGDVLEAGADSVAIISGILVPPKDISRTFKRFLSLSK